MYSLSAKAIGVVICDTVSLFHAEPIETRRIMSCGESVQNDPQTFEKKNSSGMLLAYKATKAMPRMENGADDSTNIATAPEYTLQKSGPPTASKLLRAISRRELIKMVTITLKLTVAEIHIVPKFIGVPWNKLACGRPLITTAIMPITIDRRKIKAGPMITQIFEPNIM
jgi:hypothetical protein